MQEDSSANNLGDLMDKVWCRLTDESVADSEDLQESLAQLCDGDLVDL